MIFKRHRPTEYRLTLNVLMGLYHAQKNGYKIFLDIESDYHQLLHRIKEQAHSTTDIAATIWTGRTIGTRIPTDVMALFENTLQKALQIKIHPSAKGLAWSIIACMTRNDDLHRHVSALAKLAAERYIDHDTNLVRQTPIGLRRNWSSFGAHSYMAYAFLLLARKTGSENYKNIGMDIIQKLVQLQGDKGQWGWMYNTKHGIVVDFYPIYSVHQYAYAPFFLIEAIDMGYEELREPLLKGFNWILGQNELGKSMVSNTHNVVWRNVVRRSLNLKPMKIARGAGVTWFGLNPGPLEDSFLRINRECWSFEMALPL